MRLFARGDTFGVFQFESSGMQRMLQEVRPDRFDDLVALNALYRPGPMDYIPNFKRGKHDPERRVPRRATEADPGACHGVAAYQEQLMEISKSLGDLLQARPTRLREGHRQEERAMLATLRDKFMAGCAANGVSTDGAEELWNWMEKAGGYSSTRAIARATRSWPSRPRTSSPLSRGVHGGPDEQRDEYQDRVPQYVAEARAMKIQVLPPDVNERRRFTVVGETIRFGLSAVKNVGTLASIRSSPPGRTVPSRISSTSASASSPKTYNKRTLESLIKCGAFDNVGPRGPPWSRSTPRL